ncbi:MAG: hypothetical protein OJJ21_03150 [Ferrovibrio sp.]|uniref:hypothetical protein n=1 Tax=Ferrovibrio sp. TaxID=1917215 RepID=UPI002633278F|nr:hypothetical protein [Ferrovibrio sp.]MCW0232575.1 hypothetical protein [Ferrovibrio sp.]
MGTVPSYEALLLELQQSFGQSRLQTVQKRRFAARDKRLSEHNELFVEILGGIFDAIDYEHDPEFLNDLSVSAEEIFQFYSVVENNLRTYGATDRQVAWHLLSYVFAPGFARKYAFWSLVAYVAPGMAGGDLWFVPRPSPSDPTRLRLPVQVVVEWWEDLLNCRLEDIWDASDHDEDARDWIRNLQYWRAGKLPQPNTIETAFAKMRRFKYLGTFRDEISTSLETRYQNAVSFVKEHKGFDAARLIREIPSTPFQVFQAGLTGTADEGQKEAFIAAVTERWGEPTTATVRRRFLLARVVQDCHIRLAALICPKVDPDIAGPVANKVMQIWALLEETYRLTVAAQVGCRAATKNFWTLGLIRIT